MVVPDRVVQAERLVAVAPLVAGPRVLVDHEAGYAELPQPGAEGDAALAAADDEHVGLRGAAEALGLLLAALLPGRTPLVGAVLGAHRAVLVARLLVALQLVERGEERERLRPVLVDQPEQAAAPTDGGLEPEPRGHHAVRLVGGLVQHEAGRVGALERVLQQVGDALAALDGLEVPGERHQVAPVRLGGEHPGRGGDVTRLQCGLEVGEPAVRGVVGGRRGGLGGLGHGGVLPGGRPSTPPPGRTRNCLSGRVSRAGTPPAPPAATGRAGARRASRRARRRAARRATRRWNSTGNSRSSRPATPVVGTSGQAASGQGSPNGRSAWPGSPRENTSRVTSGGTSWKKPSRTSKGASGSRPSAVSCSRRAATCPVASHHSPAVSPGRGTIALTRTIRRTSSRSQASGAENAPIDCATSVTSVASPARHRSRRRSRRRTPRARPPGPRWAARRRPHARRTARAGAPPGASTTRRRPRRVPGRRSCHCRPAPGPDSSVAGR